MTMEGSPGPAMGDSERLERATEMLRTYLTGHLVSFVGVYKPIDPMGEYFGPEQFFGFSAFLLSIRGEWYLATAAHVLEELDGLLRAREARLVASSLVHRSPTDPRAVRAVPFDYQRATTYSRLDLGRGLDFALVRLPPDVCRQLEENGASPFNEADWTDGNPFEAYFLVGLPKCFTEARITHEEIVAELEPSPIHVFRLEEPPPDEPPSEHPWFYGQLGETYVEDIDGMSGGPILGVTFDEEDWPEFWVVAIQSGWRTEERVVWACPIPFIVRMFERTLAEEDRDP